MATIALPTPISSRRRRVSRARIVALIREFFFVLGAASAAGVAPVLETAPQPAGPGGRA